MTSVRTIPWLVSTCVSTLESDAGSTKLGQPEPESNFASDRKSSVPQPAQRYTPGSSVGVGTGEGTLGPLLAQHCVLLRGEAGLPLGVGRSLFAGHDSTVPPRRALHVHPFT